MNALRIIIEYRIAFAQGLLVTLKLALVAWTFGLGIGAAVGILASRFHRGVGYLLRFTSFVLAAVPPIVLLYWSHYPLQVIAGVVIEPFVTAAAVLSLINIVVVAEIIRTAMDRFKATYRVSAQVSGMTRFETLRYVEFPLVARQTLPSLLAAQVLILQSTLFASLISVEELFRVAQRINSSIYRPIEIYTALALLFVVICLPLYYLAFVLRRRYVQNFGGE